MKKPEQLFIEIDTNSNPPVYRFIASLPADIHLDNRYIYNVQGYIGWRRVIHPRDGHFYQYFNLSVLDRCDFYGLGSPDGIGNKGLHGLKQQLTTYNGIDEANIDVLLL